jgi:heme/copper-type cytochrome/quinol oxidase subunit 1
MWAQRQPTVLSIFPTNASIVAALWVAPLAAISLLWLATLAPTKGRKPQLSLAFVCVVATFGVLAIGAVFSFVGALSSLPGFTTFNAAHIFTTVVGVPMLALVGATAMWSSQIFGGRRLPNMINVPAVLIVAGATLLIALTEYLAGVSNSPWLIADSGDVGVLGIDNAISESTFRTLAALTAAGYVVGATGLVLAVGAYKLAMYGFARPARISRSNGVTLEWAADPRLAYNFEKVPAVFSPAPLIGLDDEIDIQNKQLAEAAKS